MSPSVSGVVSHRSTRLDVMRGTAIVAVIGVHSFQAAFAGVPDSGLTEASKLFVAASDLRYGVELFFFLSGWLIFSLYGRTGRFTPGGYWARRLARIWPLWLVFTALSFTVPYLISSSALPLRAPLTPEGMSPVVAFVICAVFLGWTFTELLNVPRGGFSIQLEMGHYLGFALLHRRRARAFLLSILVGYGTYFAAQAIASAEGEGVAEAAAESWLRLGLFGSWPFFVAGGLCAVLAGVIRAEGRRSAARQVLRRWDLLALAIGVAVLATRIPIPQGTTVEAAVVVVILIGLSLLASRGALLSRSLQSLGRYSYFMYFAHFWVIAAAAPAAIWLLDQQGVVTGLAQLLVLWAALLAVATLVSWAIGIPSWRYFESRWISLAKRVT